jgi:hypothetical protein
LDELVRELEIALGVDLLGRATNQPRVVIPHDRVIFPHGRDALHAGDRDHVRRAGPGFGSRARDVCAVS